MIDSNLDLSQVDKLSYLKSLLRGPAQLALEGISMTGPNYDVAVDILRQRYGDIQRIISDHMDGLLHLEAVHVHQASESTTGTVGQSRDPRAVTG